MTDPAAVIAGALRHQRDADPDIAAVAVLAALRGHGYDLDKPKRAPKTTNTTIAYCQSGRCQRVRLDGGRCPICRWPEQEEEA